MFAEISIRGIFQLIIGIILIFMGLNTIRRQKKLEKPKKLIKGKVLHARQVKEKDEKGFYRQYYYKLHVETKENVKKERHTINCMDEYKSGDIVEIMSDPNKGGELKIFTNSKISLVGQWVMSAIGLFIFLTPFAKIRFAERYLVVLLAPMCIIVGIILIGIYLKEKNRSFENIEAELVGVLKWQKADLSQEKQKKSKSSAAFYCPILKYNYDSSDRIRRSRTHSNDYRAYDIGQKLYIYKDINSGEILEKRPKQSMAFIGILISIMGLIGLATVYFQV